MAYPYRILIVDDEADILEFVQYNLRKEGYETETADNGRSAIQKAKQFHPHLILLDIMMPLMDGIETCRELRANPQFKNPSLPFSPRAAKTIRKSQASM